MKPVAEPFDQIGATLYRAKDNTWWIRGLDGWVLQDRSGSAWAMGKPPRGVAQGMANAIDLTRATDVTRSEPSDAPEKKARIDPPEPSDTNVDRDRDANIKLIVYIVVMALTVYFIYR